MGESLVGDAWRAPTRRRRARVGGLRALAVLLPAAGSVVWGVQPALAHTSLISSTPAHDAVVERPAAAVTLVFDRPVSPRQARIVVTGPGGVDVGAGPARTAGPAVSLPVRAWPTSGGFRLSYRVLAEDGHPLTGELPFRVAPGAVGGSPPPVPSASVPPTAAGPAPAAPAVAPPAGTSAALVLVVGLSGLAVALVVGGVRAARRAPGAP